MEIAALIFGILGFLLGSAGFGLGAWSVIDLLASKRSTHRITQLPVMQEETQILSDLPQHVLDQLPSPPEKLTPEQYAKWEAQMAAEADYDE